MVRKKMGDKPDRRELPGRSSVGRVTARPKGIKPEDKEPKRARGIRSFLGQTGTGTRRKR
jgi:hypothetical protein